MTYPAYFDRLKWSFVNLSIAVGLTLLISCRTPAPANNDNDDPARLATARLNRLLGIDARTYAFTLKPNESLVVKFRARRNGTDEPGGSFTRVVNYDVYQKYERNYPTFEPLHGKRFVDIEILEAGHSWNMPRMSTNETRVSVRLPAYERNFFYEDPANSSTEFADGSSILPGRPTMLLKLNYRYRNGQERELTVGAEIRSNYTASDH